MLFLGWRALLRDNGRKARKQGGQRQREARQDVAIIERLRFAQRRGGCVRCLVNFGLVTGWVDYPDEADAGKEVFAEPRLHLRRGVGRADNFDGKIRL